MFLLVPDPGKRAVSVCACVCVRACVCTLFMITVV